MRCYAASKKETADDQTMNDVVSLASTEDIPEIVIREHEKHQGRCSVCGQHMDMRVACLIMAEGECKYLCPFCNLKFPNPSTTEDQLISKWIIKGFMQRTKLKQKKAIELIKEFTAKYALVKVSDNLMYRKYWSWDEGNPILYIKVKGKYISEIGLRGQIKF